MTDLSQNPKYLQLGALGWASSTGADNSRAPLSARLVDVLVFDQILTQEEFGLL